jgi:hypothetical protein
MAQTVDPAARSVVRPNVSHINEAIDIASGVKNYLACVNATEESADSNGLDPDDLAIVVKDDGDQFNLGIVVRIISSAGPQNWFPWDSVTMSWSCRSRSIKTWNVEALSGRGLSYHSQDCFGDLIVLRFGPIPDTYLQRLR